MTEQYHRHPHAEERIRSATAVLDALLSLDIYLPMKRRFISNCLWQITQAEGNTKYDLRYRSEGAVAAPRREWRHEHVFRRKDMVDKLLADPSSAGEIVSTAVGCVVTKAEHIRLADIDRTCGPVDGWDRYRLAGIVVLDMVTRLPLPFD